MHTPIVHKDLNTKIDMMIPNTPIITTLAFHA